jgi:hypothetical protein
MNTMLKYSLALAGFAFATILVDDQGEPRS